MHFLIETIKLKNIKIYTLPATQKTYKYAYLKIQLYQLLKNFVIYIILFILIFYNILKLFETKNS